MNQITDPDKITSKQARKDFGIAAPIVFAINIILALVMFIASDSLFREESTFLGALLAGAFVITGLISYISLRAMSKRVTMNEKINKKK